MVSWPWVLVWQLGLFCSLLWLPITVLKERQLRLLGQGLDVWILALIMGLVGSWIKSPFPTQTFWYSLSAFGYIFALYSLRSYLAQRHERCYRLVFWQASLTAAFIGISLSLWCTQTLLPELFRLAELQQAGGSATFNFTTLELRNWAPIGHQNYVAGYLLLNLPIVFWMIVTTLGWRRWLWVTVLLLGCITLYTTGSRGGTIGFIVLLSVVSLSVLRRSSSGRYRLFYILCIGVFLFGLSLTNTRLWDSLSKIVQGQISNGELSFRIVTTATGWAIGKEFLPWGAGLGNVAFLYQRYRPYWAGQEAELVFQLHNTPIQLWAEMGVIGGVLTIGALSIFIRYLYRLNKGDFHLSSSNRHLLPCLLSSFAAYSVMSMTDYQVDNVAISGTLAVLIASLSTISSTSTEQEKSLTLEQLMISASGYVSLSKHQTLAIVTVSFGLILSLGVWLLPINKAWMLSSQGFSIYKHSPKNIEALSQSLQQAHTFSPWEPYYPLQLGWILGNLSREQSIPNNVELRDAGIKWLKIGNTLAPYQEFGYTNLGWLLLSTNAAAATQNFTRSAQLVPAKSGIFFGLGLSLLNQNKVSLAIDAFCLEILRHPVFITSPIWKTPRLQPLESELIKRLDANYTKLLNQPNISEELSIYLHHSRGVIHWWQGQFHLAHKDLDQYGSQEVQATLALSETKILSEGEVANYLLTQSTGAFIMLAWLYPQNRAQYLQSALLHTIYTGNSTLQSSILKTMDAADNFHQWITKLAPTQYYRHQRSGFGVLSRHIDGVLPQDFWIVHENIVASRLLNNIFPSERYSPNLDHNLQILRLQLLEVASQS